MSRGAAPEDPERPPSFGATTRQVRSCMVGRPLGRGNESDGPIFWLHGSWGLPLGGA